MPRRFGTNEQLGLPRTRGGQRAPPHCANPRPSTPAHSVLSSRLLVTAWEPTCLLSLVDGSPWDSSWRIFQLTLQDLLGKALPLLFPPADGLAAWCLGQGEGSFLSREGREYLGIWTGR